MLSMAGASMTETTGSYQPPVSRLLTYGDCLKVPHQPDYLALGLGREHIPDLIRMTTDESLHSGATESLDVWAPVHAWRALGQLHAEAAIEPLISLLHFIDDENDDWVNEELPDVFAQIGPAAIPALASYLADTTNKRFARVAAAEALGKIARAYPSARTEGVRG